MADGLLSTAALAIGGEIIRVQHAEDGADAFELWPSMGEYPIYDAFLYTEMTTDEVRNKEYRHALEALARDKVVLDLGTGKDMVWALEAAKAGARKVYAIEEIESAYREAAARIRQLGLEQRIHLLHGNATHLTLPERAEICVSEVIGNIGSSEGAVAVLRDARARLLRPDARLIPWRCITEIAAFSLPETFAAAPHFTSRALPYVERLLRLFGRPVELRLCCRNVPATAILSDSDVFEDLDFLSDAPPQRSRPIALTLTKTGRLDGFLLWIKLFCAEGGTAIDSLRSWTNWRPMFFPVFCSRPNVVPGDRVVATVETTLSPDGIHPNFRVSGRLEAQAGITEFDYASLHNADAQAGTLPIYRRLFA